MDRPLAPWLCFGLALFSSAAFAELPAGAAEYNAAQATAATLLALAQEMSAVSDEQAKALSEADKKAARKQLLETALKYPQQLKAAADKGFAPAQFAYANVLKTKASLEPAQRDALKGETCALLEKAAASGLFMAALAKGRFCYPAYNPADVGALLQRERAVQQQLAEAITRPDPFGAYYPLKAFRLAECFMPQVNPHDSSLTPMQSLQASQPPALTLDETLAEGYFQLASNSTTMDKAQVLAQLAKAEALGCDSTAFAALKRHLNKPAPAESKDR